jgi:tetratricopeptide (TPR) repeat protein
MDAEQREKLEERLERDGKKAIERRIAYYESLLDNLSIEGRVQAVCELEDRGVDVPDKYYNEALKFLVNKKDYAKASKLAKEGFLLDRAQELALKQANQYIEEGKFDAAVGYVKSNELLSDHLEDITAKAKELRLREIVETSLKRFDLGLTLETVETFSSKAISISVEDVLDLCEKEGFYNKGRDLAEEADLNERAAVMYEKQGRFKEAAKYCRTKGLLEKAEFYEAVDQFVKGEGR